MREEHYEAQGKYADMLFKFLGIPWWHPIDKIRAMRDAEAFRDTHRECCEWASEEELW